AKISSEITSKMSGGLEYYGEIGPVRAFDPLSTQQHLLFPVVDLNLGPQWECNVGLGFGLTHATDRFLVKLIRGYRFDVGSGWTRGHEKPRASSPGLVGYRAGPDHARRGGYRPRQVSPHAKNTV